MCRKGIPSSGQAAPHQQIVQPSSVALQPLGTVGLTSPSPHVDKLWTLACVLVVMNDIAARGVRQWKEPLWVRPPIRGQLRLISDPYAPGQVHPPLWSLGPRGSGSKLGGEEGMSSFHLRT